MVSHHLSLGRVGPLQRSGFPDARQRRNWEAGFPQRDGLQSARLGILAGKLSVWLRLLVDALQKKQQPCWGLGDFGLQLD